VQKIIKRWSKNAFFTQEWRWSVANGGRRCIKIGLYPYASVTFVYPESSVGVRSRTVVARASRLIDEADRWYDNDRRECARKRRKNLRHTFHCRKCMFILIYKEQSHFSLSTKVKNVQFVVLWKGDLLTKDRIQQTIVSGLSNYTTRVLSCTCMTPRSDLSVSCFRLPIPSPLLWRSVNFFKYTLATKKTEDFRQAKI